MSNSNFIDNLNDARQRVKENFWISSARALFDTDLLGVRLTLCFAEIIWATLLFWPGDTFARPTYHVMAEVMDEEWWGLIFAISGICQYLIITFENFGGKVARYFSAWNASLWVFVTLSMMNSVTPPPAAISGEIALAIMSSWICFRPILISIVYHYAIKRKSRFFNDSKS